MTKLKDERQELFLREYFANGWNGTQAYRTAYGDCKSAYQQAHKLFKRPDVKRRFNQMQKRIIKRADLTEERILTQYQDAYDLAESQGKSADMISATTAQAKLIGMLRERMEHGAPGEFGHLDSISDVLVAIEEQAGPEVAQKLGQALGVLVVEVKPAEDTTQLAQTPAASDSVN